MAVILPTFNEALNLPILLPRLLGVIEHGNVMVVDDGSPDDTASLVEDMARTESRLLLLRRPGKAGRGSAVLAGYREALLRDEHYDCFAEMDADLSHQPEELPGIVSRIAAGADLVIGSRYVRSAPAIEGWPARRRVWSRASNSLLKMGLRLPMTDFTNGFRAYSRRAVQFLTEQDLQETGFISLSECAFLIHQAGMSIVEEPSRFINRRLGQSNMSAAEAVGAARGLVRLRRSAWGRRSS